MSASELRPNGSASRSNGDAVSNLRGRIHGLTMACMGLSMVFAVVGTILVMVFMVRGPIWCFSADAQDLNAITGSPGKSLTPPPSVPLTTVSPPAVQAPPPVSSSPSASVEASASPQGAESPSPSPPPRSKAGILLLLVLIGLGVIGLILFLAGRRS